MLKHDSKDGNSLVELSNEQTVTLVRLVVGHTRKLADANSVDLAEVLEPGSDCVEDPIVDLSRYLEAQRRILNEAA